MCVFCPSNREGILYSGAGNICLIRRSSLFLCVNLLVLIILLSKQGFFSYLPNKQIAESRRTLSPYLIGIEEYVRVTKQTKMIKFFPLNL